MTLKLRCFLQHFIQVVRVYLCFCLEYYRISLLGYIAMDDSVKLRQTICRLIYRAIRNFEPWKHRYEIDDVVLEMEASECLFQQLKTK